MIHVVLLLLRLVCLRSSETGGLACQETIVVSAAADESRPTETALVQDNDTQARRCYYTIPDDTLPYDTTPYHTIPYTIVYYSIL